MDVKIEIDFNIEVIGYVVFIFVFFVSIGLLVIFNMLGKDLFFILVMMIMVILMKLLGGVWGVKMVGFFNISFLMVGVGMVLCGEMVLIIV